MTGQPAESVYWTRYRQGWWEGHADGYQDGYSDGYADAMRATAPDPPEAWHWGDTDNTEQHLGTPGECPIRGCVAERPPDGQRQPPGR